MRHKNIQLTKSGFTLIELLVVIAIISLLVSILIPSLTKAKELAREVICQTQLRSISQGYCMYYGENECLPLAAFNGTVHYKNGDSDYNFDPLHPLYIDTVEMFYCPNVVIDPYNFDPDVKWKSYSTIGYAYRSVLEPGLWTYMENENVSGASMAIATDLFTYNYRTHTFGYNVGYFDGSVLRLEDPDNALQLEYSTGYKTSHRDAYGSSIRLWEDIFDRGVYKEL